MATIRDVARAARVSVATVSAVINGTKHVSAELRERVQKAIEELEFEPSCLGRALSLRRTFTLAYLVPTITNPFFPAITKAVEEVAFNHGYGLLICNTEGSLERARQYQKALLGWRVDGLLITLTSELVNSEIYSPFLKHGIPVVGLAGARAQPHFDCIITDDAAAMQMLAQYLWSIGHRRFGYIGVEGSRSTTERIASLRRELESKKRSVADGEGAFSSLTTAFASGYSESDGYVAARELLLKDPRPTVLVCYNDVLAVGAMRACRELGFKIPSDVSVVGFDDTLASLTVPPLTTLAVPLVEMGHLAARLLLHQIESQRRSDASRTEPARTSEAGGTAGNKLELTGGTAGLSRKCHRFLPQLVVRESCSPPPPL